MKNKGYITYISVLNYVIIGLLVLSFLGADFKEDAIYQVIKVLILIPFIISAIFLKKFINANFKDNK